MAPAAGPPSQGGGEAARPQIRPEPGGHLTPPGMTGCSRRPGENL